MVNGFSSEMYKNLQKFKLFTAEEVIFEGYCEPGPISYDFNISVADNPAKGVLDKLNPRAGLLGAVVQGIGTGFDLPMGGLDYERLAVYLGTDSLKFTVDVMLLLREDWNKDIVNPLNRLLQFILPERDAEYELSSIATNFVGSADVSSDLQALLQKVVDYGTQFIGKVYALKVPEAFRDRKDSKGVNFRKGTHVIHNVFVKNCKVEFPQPSMSLDPEGIQAVPDHVKVSLSFETMRKATVDQYKFS